MVFMSIKLYKDARTVRIWKCIQFRRQGGEERGGRGHALPLVYLQKTPHGSAVSRKAPLGGCWVIVLYFELS